MKLSKCANGHFYDGDKYPECPYCNTDLLKDHGWLVVLDGEAKGRDLRLGIGRSFLGLDDAGAPITLSADAPLSARQAVVVYDAEKNSFVLLPGSSQELCYLGEEAVLAPSPLTGGETLRLGGAALTFVPLCGGAFHW